MILIVLYIALEASSNSMEKSSQYSNSSTLEKKNQLQIPLEKIQTNKAGELSGIGF